MQNAIAIVLSILLSIIVAVPPAAHSGPVEAQRPENGPDINVQQVDVRYLTLRNKAKGRFRSQHYGGNRDQLRTGICSIEFAPIWGMKSIAESIPFYVPDQSKELTAVAERPESRIWEEIEAFDADSRGNMVLYIHGYNIGFEKSCRRAAMFQSALNLDERLLLFSWPADGNFLKYTYDEADLVWSVPQLEQVIDGIVSRVGNQKLDIVSHSLGARGAVQALAAIACQGVAQPLINELILLAPDIDADLFRQRLPVLREAVKRITLYVSENDNALAASHEVHGYPRLGEAGEHLTVLEGIETIDISPSGKRRMSGHIYHIFNPAVVNDLKALLTTGKPAGQRPGLVTAEHNGHTYWRLQPIEIEEDIESDG